MHSVTKEHYSILVVEDDKDIRDCIQSVLELEGYSVQTSENGREALDHLASRTPSLILLDLMMPVMDGWEFLQKLNQLPSDRKAPVVVVSAVANQSDKATLSFLAKGFVKKPIDLDALLLTVQRFCDQAA